MSQSAPADEGQWGTYLFGPFAFCPERQLLLKHGAPVRIGGRALALLGSLVRTPGEVVTKKALMESAWSDVVVDDGNLKVNMSALRRVLSHDDGVDYIATVTGRGYRFVAPVGREAGALPDPAPARVTAQRSNNLAISTTRVLGRAEAIESLVQDVTTSRLVSIVGPGGVGKTTVAVAVAERMLDQMPDGVWMADLSSVRDSQLLPSAIAIAMGATAQIPHSNESLCAFLEGRDLLLLIDSCEHLIEAVADCVDGILKTVPKVRILVTSREPLVISGERVRRLAGLATPPATVDLAAEEALQFAAVQLFVERASERHEGFQLTDATAPIAANICRRLDGLALAIELVAAHVESFGLGGLHKQLRAHGLPSSSRRSGPERHRTLASTIEWSYGLLPAHEAAVLRAITAFAGSFDAKGAAAVSDQVPEEVASTLAQLAAKSLLSIDLNGDTIAYRLLETTRQFCLERLRSDPAHSAIRQRHAQYVCSLLNRATNEWAQRPNQEFAANYQRALGDLYASILTTTMTSQALMFQAMDAMRRALEIAEETHDLDAQLRSSRMLGVYELFVGDPRSAIHTFEKLERVVALHSPDHRAESATYMGTTELFLGRLVAGRERLERLWQLTLEQSHLSPGSRVDKDAIATAENVLPHLRWLTGSPDAAVQLSRAAIVRSTALEQKIFRNNALSYGSHVLYWAGLFEECFRCATDLEIDCETNGYLPRRPVARIIKAAISCSHDDQRAEGILAMQTAIDDIRLANYLARLPYYLGLLAEAMAHHGQASQAETTIKAAFVAIDTQGEQWCLPELFRIEAVILSKQGRDATAEAGLMEAMKRADSIGALSWKLRAANDLAQLFHRHNRSNEIRPLLEPVYQRFTEGHATLDLRRTRALLGGA